METAGQVGIPLSELWDMDIRAFNNYVIGYIRNRETMLNDSLLTGHIIAGKISMAVWGDRQFSKPIKPIKLLKDQKEKSLDDYCKKQMLEFAKNWILND